MALSRGLLFDRRGNPTWVALLLLFAAAYFIYRDDPGQPPAGFNGRPSAQRPYDHVPDPHPLPDVGAPGANVNSIGDYERRVRVSPNLLKEPPQAAVLPPPPPPPPPPPAEGHGDTIAGASRHKYQNIPERAPTTDYRPVSLTLELPDKYLHEPALETREKMFRQYGFNLKASNELPLARSQPDIRSPQCKAVTYPRPTQMPQASVIIIFYNEAMSTLLRNVIGVLNRTPPDMLGELLLVDDNSSLPQLELLQGHLDRITPVAAREKIRLVRRKVHNGIVGARNRGAKEAVHDIIVFLDSHAEVTPGWLEPLVARIHEDRTRVVIPDLRPIDLNRLTIPGGSSWPPYKGSFNWRLSFIIVGADPDRDVLGPNKRVGPVRSPIMPGGLFAMDREFFNELGQYDPEIMYYGGEHIELSFKVWMCGGSMENIPCSHIGHIYREFDRFAVDPGLKNKNIGKALDKNDIRVAEVSPTPPQCPLFYLRCPTVTMWVVGLGLDGRVQKALLRRPRPARHPIWRRQRAASDPRQTALQELQVVSRQRPSRPVRPGPLAALQRDGDRPGPPSVH